MPASNPKEPKLEDNDNSLDVSATQSALEAIDTCQNEIDALNEKASEEILTVEQKYNKLRRPHFINRNKIIQKIPSFWYQAFVNHPQISSILDEEEEECLQCLSNVDVEEFADIKSGYKLTFIFKENDFFTNTELVKEFQLATTGEPESKSTLIEWKEGKNLTNNAKQQANGRKRPLSSPQGFFAWFLNNTDPNADEIAEVIKDDMWPNPLQYYLASDLDDLEASAQSDEDLDDSVVDVNDEDSEDDGLNGESDEEDDDEEDGDDE
ncbi:protein SET [Aplysia californica]|uniref:Protein SET n=1 Tax=Aplysia californica TaxID=6500 RepID=A0ABM0JNK6_APLCA|nr:protein SET [Aplysia californica]